MEIRVEMTCPHCLSRCSADIPGLGTMLLALCPRCREWVVLLMGDALPIDKEVLLGGDRKRARKHLNETISEFFESSITALLDDTMLPTADRDEVEGRCTPVDMLHSLEAQPQSGQITPREIERFRAVELRFLDNPEYFDNVFRRDRHR